MVFRNHKFLSIGNCIMVDKYVVLCSTPIYTFRTAESS